MKNLICRNLACRKRIKENHAVRDQGGRPYCSIHCLNVDWADRKFSVRVLLHRE